MKEAYKYSFNRLVAPDYPRCNYETEIADAYEQGYKDAIDKACEWLKDNFANASELLICYIGNSDMNVMVKHFKQFMEEQQ